MDFDRRSRKHHIRAEVKDRFGGACAYCGRVPYVLTLDHIVAKSKGGFDRRSNLVAVCRRCNKSKASQPLWDWWQASPWWDETRARQLSETVLVCQRRQPSLADNAQTGLSDRQGSRRRRRRDCR